MTTELEGETGQPSFEDESLKLPAGVPAFRHQVQGMKTDARSNTWVSDGGNIELSPLNPGFVDASDALITSTLHTKLADVMVANATVKKYLAAESVRTRKATGGDRIRVAIVDLTGARLIKPDFAGWGSPVAVEAASCAKVAGLHAVFQLRHELEQVIKADPAITTVARLAAAMRKQWERFAGAPNLARLLDASVSPPALEFSRDVKWAVSNIIDHDNANEAARILIEAAGFPYIASLMWQSGLRHPTRGGMWLTSSYNSSARWGGALPPPGPHYGHTTTALSMATFFALLAQGRLTSPAASTAMKAALTQASWFGQTLTSARISSKVGLLLRCIRKKPKMVRGQPVPGKDGQPVMVCDAYEATHAHEAGLIENGSLRYAVAIMTVGVPDGVKVMKELVAEIDTLVRANNP